MDPLAASQSDASSSDSEDDASPQKQHLPTTIAASPNQHTEDVGQKKPSLDFEAISRHGYSGGPSVLYVPAPRSTEAGEQDWSWSTGSRKVENSEQDEENIEQRDQTRQIVNDSAVQAATQAIAGYNHAKRQKREAAAELRALSYSQKEKRKRDLGQSSRGKNYVEEEKRLLRDQGVYSGFDT